MRHPRSIMLTLAATAIIAAIWLARRDNIPPGHSLEQARAALRQGRYDDAEQLALQSATGAMAPAAWLVAGEAAGKAGRSDQALEYLGRIGNELEDEAVTARSLEGELQWHLGNSAAAERGFRQALRLRPQAVFARHRLAYLLAIEGRSWEAIEHLLELLRIEQAGRDQLLLIPELSRSVGLTTDLERFHSVCPDDPGPLIGLSWRAHREHRPAEAERFARQAVARDPGSIEAHALLGVVLSASSDQAALAKWNVSLPSDAERHPIVWQVLGQTAHDQGKPKAALRCFWEAIRRDPNQTSWHTQLAALLTAQGMSDQAAPFAERAARLLQADLAFEAARLAPDDSGLVVTLARQLIDLGRLWEAHAWLNSLSAEVSREEPIVREREALAARLTPSTPLTLDEANPALRIDLSGYPLPETAIVAAVDGPLVSDRAKPHVRWAEVASQVGIGFQNHSGADPATDGSRFIETTGGGVGVVDYDADGWPDLYFTQGSAWPCDPGQTTYRDEFFRNVAGRFQDVTAPAGLGDNRFSQGIAAGDWDNDGFVDLFLANHGLNRLYRNNGDGTFEDVSAMVGIAGERWTTSALIADVNGDAMPDLYEVNYVEGEVDRICTANGRPARCLPDWFHPQHDRLWINRGDGRFDDVSESANVLAPQGNGMGIIAADFEGEGRLSLFIANDRTANFYFANRGASPDGQPRFAEQALIRGVAVDRDGRPQACMGVACDDANGDGRLDLFVTNFYGESNTLYVQESNGGAFVDRTIEAGLRGPSLSMLGFGAQFLDGELDGWPDLVVTNGHIDDLRPSGEPYKMRPQYFHNLGSGKFAESTPDELGGFFMQEKLGRGMALIDWNRDGLEEVAISHIDEPAALLVNQTPGAGHFLAVRLRGTQSPRDAVGAAVHVLAGGRTRVRQWTAGSGYQASNQPQLVFGLGEATRVDELTLHWPSGLSQSFGSLPADGEWLLIEGDSQPHRLPTPEP